MCFPIMQQYVVRYHRTFKELTWHEKISFEWEREADKADTEDPTAERQEKEDHACDGKFGLGFRFARSICRSLCIFPLSCFLLALSVYDVETEDVAHSANQWCSATVEDAEEKVVPL